MEIGVENGVFKQALDSNINRQVKAKNQHRNDLYQSSKLTNNNSRVADNSWFVKILNETGVLLTVFRQSPILDLSIYYQTLTTLKGGR